MSSLNSVFLGAGKQRNGSQEPSITTITDFVGLIFALLFVRSVISNALDLIQTQVKNAPASYALILSVGFIGWTAAKRRRLSLIGVVTLTIIATSGVIWVFGIHR